MDKIEIILSEGQYTELNNIVDILKRYNFPITAHSLEQIIKRLKSKESKYHPCYEEAKSQ